MAGRSGYAPFGSAPSSGSNMSANNYSSAEEINLNSENELGGFEGYGEIESILESIIETGKHTPEQFNSLTKYISELNKYLFLHKTKRTRRPILFVLNRETGLGRAEAQTLLDQIRKLQTRNTKGVLDWGKRYEPAGSGGGGGGGGGGRGGARRTRRKGRKGRKTRRS